MTVSSISLVTFTVAANLVFLRMYVRIRRHKTGWDDYTICIALVSSVFYSSTTRGSPLLTRTGTFSLRNRGQRISRCEWHWQAYRNFDTRTAVRVHQVDFCWRSRIRHQHLLRQTLRVYLYSAPYWQDSADYALLCLCSYGLLDRLDPWPGHCLAGSVQTTKGPLCSRFERKVLFEKCINRSRILPGR